MNDNDKRLIQEYDLLVLDSLSKMTRKEYLHNLKQFTEFLDSENKDFSQLTALDLALFLKNEKERCVGKTLQRKHSAIRKFYLFLRKKHLISSEEIELIKDVRPKAMKNEEAHRTLSDQEIEQCLMTITHPLFRFIFFLGIEFGLRRTEYTRLKLSDVDLERKKLRIHGKGDKIRFIPIANRLVSMFEGFFKQRERDQITHDYLLYSKTGKTIGRTIERYFEQMSRLSKIKFTSHDLRVTFATRYWRRGCDIYVISQMLGHASITTTMIYLKPTKQELDKRFSAIADQM